MIDAATAFRSRLLTERTELLARRGQAPEEAAAALPDRLVCATGTRLFALPTGLVGQVRATAFHAIPLIAHSAAHAMLGVFSHGGLPYSLLELSRLLDPDEPAGVAIGGGRMLLLRQPVRRRVALRVDEVLGVLALPAAADRRYALLPDRRLAILLDAADLHAAIDALDPADGLVSPT